MFLLIAAGRSDTARAGLGEGARCSRVDLYSGAAITDVEVVEEEVVVAGADCATVCCGRADSISKYSNS